MIFQVVSVVVPLLLVLVAPIAVKKFRGDDRRYRPLLYLACLVFFISWYLPSPFIDGRDTSFVTHFVGGGIFTGLLWYYLKSSFGWKGRWYIEGAGLFGLVSALGVVNELFELFLFKIGGMSAGIADTSWDLLANTLGAFVFFCAYLLLKKGGSEYGRRN